MTSTQKTQARGNCQCCGREQAVLKSGNMSKHGYEVSEYHYFQGVCTGERYKPIQHERDVADSIAKSVRADVAKNLALVEKLKAGKTFPLEAKSGKRVRDEARARAGKFPMVEEFVAFELAPKHHQDAAVVAMIYRCETQARHGTSFADQFEKLIRDVHGEALRIVVLQDGPALIDRGDKRSLAHSAGDRVLECIYVQAGRRVYYKSERNGKTYSGSWMGIAAWRKLPAAA